MESEEAILENENNSNLECESGLRSRDESMCVDGMHSNASVVIHDAQPFVDFSSGRSSNSAIEITSLDKVLSFTSVTQAELADKCDDRLKDTSSVCEKSVDIEHLANAGKAAVESDSSGRCIQDYGDFTGSSSVSQLDGAASSKISHGIHHILSTDNEKYTNLTEPMVEEGRDAMLSHGVSLLERQPARETESMETEETDLLAVSTSVVHEKVEMERNVSILTGPSKEFNTSSHTSKCWEDEIDLLEEGSQDSANHEHNSTGHGTDNSLSKSHNSQDEASSVRLSENGRSDIKKLKPHSVDISETEEVMAKEERSGAETKSEYLLAQLQPQSDHVEKDIDDVEIVDEEDPQIDVVKVVIPSSESNSFSKNASSECHSSDTVQSVKEMNIVLDNVISETVEPTALSSGDILNVSSSDSSESEFISSAKSKQTYEKEVKILKQVSTQIEAANNNDNHGERPMKTTTVEERTPPPPPGLTSGDSSIPGSSIKQNSGLSDSVLKDTDLEFVEVIEEANATPMEINSHDSDKLTPGSEHMQINKDVLEATSASPVLVDATKHGNSGPKDTAESNDSVNTTSGHHGASNQLQISEIKTECNPCNINGSTDDLVMYDNEVASQGVKQEPHVDGDDDDDVVIIDDEGEVVPLKKEVVETRTTENGVDTQMSGSVGTEKNLGTSSEPGNSKADSPKSKLTKQKLQTCIVCQKICRCKYNIVRNGDLKHLCDDACFKQFKKSPNMFLKQKRNLNAPPASNIMPDLPPTSTSNVASQGSTQESQFKTCSVCQLIDVNASQPFCNWKGLDFCGESCLGKFQANLNASCSFCQSYIPPEVRTNFCLKIGNNMRPFCKHKCYSEFKKKLRLCSFCQRDVTAEPGAFTAIVGADNKFREFCSQACMKNTESQINNVEVLSVEKGHVRQETITCSVCRKQGPVKYTVRLQDEWSKLCSDLCLSAFQYTNKISMGRCDSCGVPCTTEEAKAHFIQHEGKVKRFCSDLCVNSFRTANSRPIPCGWCGTKKLNFDMIERLDTENKVQLFCSLNCLSLYRVSLQAKSNQAVQCDQCRKVVPAQYHLTMSDASVRNFCSYSCVMNFQVQFEVQRVPPVFGATPQPLSASSQGQFLPQGAPVQQNQPLKPTPARGGGRMTTRQATAREHSPSYPVISSVVSLAEHEANTQPTLPPPLLPPLPAVNAVAATRTHVDSMVPSGDGRHQIIIQAAVPKFSKNKSLQCRPVMLTKATSCRPHSQNKEVQTDEVPMQPILIPVPVPVYIPVPTVMFTAPAPKIVPIPIPIPVPVFLPTTRKSITGVCRTIQDIVERIPADPLEAELLQMAEAVAGDKTPGNSDTDSEAEAAVEDPIGGNESLAQSENESSSTARTKECGDEDMLQLALRMAEEMSGPIEDLETSVEPLTIKTDRPGQQPKKVEPYHSEDDDDDDDYIPRQTGRGRGAKRSNRGRPPSARPKRQRTDRTSEDDFTKQPGPSSQSQPTEPPDVNYRLKFTYGLNAWRHWVISKNMQIENSVSQMNVRARTFPTDILKCTVDELNTSMCMFVDEVRKPSGNEYSPDSIYYLCLGIQQYLYENGRIDSLFSDPYFEKFTDRLNEILKTLQPKMNKHGQMLCRIEEEHLWESKQLGAHSPFVLLNTLVYFHTKYFILKTVQDHMALSFAQILKHWKKGVPLKGQPVAIAKNVSLRFYCVTNGKK
ncbi:unnamed protein product, partial [Candidula unifasciata]